MEADTADRTLGRVTTLPRQSFGPTYRQQIRTLRDAQATLLAAVQDRLPELLKPSTLQQRPWPETHDQGSPAERLPSFGAEPSTVSALPSDIHSPKPKVEQLPRSLLHPLDVPIPKTAAAVAPPADEDGFFQGVQDTAEGKMSRAMELYKTLSKACQKKPWYLLHPEASVP
eukprot:jgi/Chrzof1/11211/Cz05g28060.t1